MKQGLSGFALIFILVVMSGCSYILPRQVAVLGQDSKTDRCNPGYSVYYYRDADVGVCLPEIMAVYTHCVTELTVANSSFKFDESGTLKSAEVLDKVKGLDLTAQQKRDLDKVFADSGSIGVARGKAIDQCYILTADVYGNGTTKVKEIDGSIIRDATVPLKSTIKLPPLRE
ncbi:hypothetical protein [Pseudomonas wadenswilerensis]|uniref:hypothetical protein n=1 Tax=Pseudomonas wadenswilerensis TaxID=1785161 RepID=UPI00215FE62C|nr:hypothetical protein [Pseudomonas wadenswilerensis]UVM19566.1 hypothetical protein LOY45_13930 [Pseudomonas wadenswilerensis]